MPRPTPSKRFVDRLEELRKAKLITEREVCDAAGASETIVGAARNRGGNMGWDHVFAIAEVIHERTGLPLDWLLWGEGPIPMTIVREGPGTAEVKPRVITPRKRPRDALSPPDASPRPGKNRRRM
jgi:transcriptional regulator with XRE-family HTH domain